MKLINATSDTQRLAEVAETLRGARKAVALTGAGISVGSGIPDFRSRGGLWTKFAPDEYATLGVFYENPEKAWLLYRELGRVLLGKKANAAHHALAEFEQSGYLRGIITQNVDNLHQQAGSRTVIEIHGDHQHLQCLQCGGQIPVCPDHYEAIDVPRCASCRFPLKPNVVLFGEPVRDLEAIEALLEGCDLLLVIGTSAQVYPAAAIPPAIKRGGGRIIEFNREQTLGRDRFSGISTITDYFFEGDVVETLPLLSREVNGRL